MKFAGGHHFRMLSVCRANKVKSKHLEAATGRPRPAWRAPVSLLESVPEETSNLVWVKAGDGQEGGMWARSGGREASPETIADATAAAAATPDPFYGCMDLPAPIPKKRPLPKTPALGRRSSCVAPSSADGCGS